MQFPKIITDNNPDLAKKFKFSYLKKGFILVWSVLLSVRFFGTPFITIYFDFVSLWVYLLVIFLSFKIF
jgi:hypothetical protein